MRLDAEPLVKSPLWAIQLFPNEFFDFDSTPQPPSPPVPRVWVGWGRWGQTLVRPLRPAATVSIQTRVPLNLFLLRAPQPMAGSWVRCPGIRDWPPYGGPSVCSLRCLAEGNRLCFRSSKSPNFQPMDFVQQRPCSTQQPTIVPPKVMSFCRCSAVTLTSWGPQWPRQVLSIPHTQYLPSASTSF